mmetsp:Transcript_32224/g.96964  ORF Transcript_32224/g.96964 Transcript_32224/m.96964 type:complete len:489 (+) Transcript_32224:942-2408(+)
MGHRPGDAHLRDLPGQPAPRARGGRQDVQDEVREPRHEPALRGPTNDAVLHHLAEPRLRGRRLVAAGRLEGVVPKRKRPVERGHHPHLQAVLLGPVPPGGGGRALRHRVPLRVVYQSRPRRRAAADVARPGDLPPRPRLAEARPPRGLGRFVDRPGGRVRLLRLASHQGAERGRHRGRAHQPEHRHRPDVARGPVVRGRRDVEAQGDGVRGPRLPAAGDGGERPAHPGQGEEHRRHHRLHGRADRAQRGHRALEQPGLAEARRPRARYEDRRHRRDRGPRDLLDEAPGDRRDARPFLPGDDGGGRARGRAQDRLPGAGPGRVHARRAGLGLRRERRGAERPRGARARGRLVDDEADPDRPGPAGLEGGRVRSRPRRPRQLHHRLQHGELRPARRAHGRLHRRRAVADAVEPRVLQIAVDRPKGHPPHRDRRRVQHPVRARPEDGEILHHRSQRAPLAVVRARVQGDGLPARVRRRETFAGPGPRLHPQ